MQHEVLIEFLAERMGLCGCSEDDGAVRFLFDLLEAGEMRDAGLVDESNATLDDILPEGDCLERNLPIYWIAGAGLTEHGWTLAGYGLSDLGREVLEALREGGGGEGDSFWVTDDEPPAPAAAAAPATETVWN